jgi:aminocarboxymuconate-semialdehyde decarboxylase
VRILSLSTPNVYPWGGAAQAAMARQVNDALARLCRAHPDRFVGLASLPLADTGAALAELERALGELGMKGVVIGSNVDGMAMNDARMEPVWARINALRLPVFEHPMFPKETAGLGEFELPLRVGLIFDTTLAATRMIYGGVFERYPDFPYILGHTGGALLTVLERLDNGYRLFPDCRKFISKPPSAYAKRLYYDTCAFHAPALKMAIESVGAGQLLFGTDDPYIDADAAHVERLALGAADQAAILGGSAAKLFGLR